MYDQTLSIVDYKPREDVSRRDFLIQGVGEAFEEIATPFTPAWKM
jgi:hypothetical protein